MRKLGLTALFLSALLVAGGTAVSQDAAKVPYQIDFDSVNDVKTHERDKEGHEGLFVTVKFAITGTEGGAGVGVGDDYVILIEENGRKVKEVAIPRPTVSEDLSIMLAIDTSGSMKEHGRMAQARAAAETFLTKLPKAADCGLILFDHEIRHRAPPIFPREPLLAQVRKVQPRGGTAYLDAASEGVRTLAAMPPGRDKAVVLLTDGIDLNSAKNLEQVIAEAVKSRVRVYTIGIGEPGKLERVSTALVVDHSGSMKPPASDGETTPKIKAMHEAASRFVRSMSSAGRCSLIPFSSTVGTPQPFTNNKYTLTAAINRLTPSGETALFDATYAAVATLEADDSTGKRAVVAMTDGIDNSSRHRVEEVIARAKEAKIPLHLLGFGRKAEIDHETMTRMARETGGQYHYVANKSALVSIFESLSIKLHDDGIDEYTLKQLAGRTGGQYYPAKNVSELKFILENVSKSIQRHVYEITFKSLNQRRAGDQRQVGLRLVRRSASGDTTIGEKTGRYQTGGLVVAEMNHFVYLALLGLLGGLIVLPAMMSRRRDAT